MTLILRSTAVATNTIGNVHGDLQVPGYRAMLNFDRDEYFTVTNGVRKNFSLAEAVIVERASTAPYYDRQGVVRSVAANTARRHFIAARGAAGLAVFQRRVNFVPAGANGTALTVASAGEQVLLSFRGGDVGLTASSLTLAETWSDDGRTVKRYTRSTTAPIDATLAVSGGALDIQVELAVGGFFASPFAGYGSTVATETVSLASDFVALFAGGKGTIVLRSFYPPSSSQDERSGIYPIALKTAQPQGGIYHRISGGKGVIGTDTVLTGADGSGVNAATQRANVTGNWRDGHVEGLTFSGFGDVSGVIGRGQTARATALGARFGEIAAAYIGGETGAGPGGRVGAIITHCMIYDRLLTSDECLRVVNQWL